MKRNYLFLIIILVLFLQISTFFSQDLSGLERSVALTPLQQDSLALVAFYDSTDGDNWTNNDNWKFGPLNTWHGVVVAEDRVKEVILSNNNLNGIIPAEIGNLSELIYIAINSNQITGSIPPEIENLTNLTDLYFNENQLSGAIPAEIGNLTELTAISLARNQLTDTIPKEIGNLTNLTILILADNHIMGNIPSEIGNLTNLRTLSLSHNQLVDAIPKEIGNLTNLKVLYLSENQLTGAIPLEIWNLTKLGVLYLHENQLSGSIPEEIVNLTTLVRFYIHQNRFIDLPDISSITSLSELKIHENRFTFEDIEPNIGINGFNYIPQDSVGEKQDTTLTEGESITLSVDVGGTSNQYQWKKDGVPIEGATDSDYTIETVTLSDSGAYTCEITNTVVTDLILYSRPVNVLVKPTTDVLHQQETMPDQFNLLQNYPNPFNPETIIQYHVANECHVLLRVYNIKGQEITTLVDEHQNQGKYKVHFNCNNIPSGIYFYKIQMNDFNDVKKMIKIE